MSLRRARTARRTRVALDVVHCPFRLQEEEREMKYRLYYQRVLKDRLTALRKVCWRVPEESPRMTSVARIGWLGVKGDSYISIHIYYARHKMSLRPCFP